MLISWLKILVKTRQESQEFKNFIAKLKVLNKFLPNISKYKSAVTDEWEFSYETRVHLRGSASYIKEVLPLKSLIVTEELRSINKVHVKFNQEEFDKVFSNQALNKCQELFDFYLNIPSTEKKALFNSNKDTFNLLIECLEQEIHFKETVKVKEIATYLLELISENEVSYNESLLDRVNFEIEFIRKQKENNEFLHNFQK